MLLYSASHISTSQISLLLYWRISLRLVGYIFSYQQKLPELGHSRQKIADCLEYQ
jgi:hypothetical protein